MRAPDDFQPQLVNTSSMPYAAPPAWLRSQRYPGEETFGAADKHAMQVAQQQHDSFKDLLFHLVYTERWSDVEAARVLFRWMTSKHMYSIQFAGAPPGSPEELIMGFSDGRSTYCRIFELLCLYSGIPCITVVGYGKGIEVRPGHPLQDKTFNHSWNVIFVDDAWQLVDCHWAARYLQSNDSNVPEDMVYEYDDFYFCPDPEALLYSHFPEDPKWQLLKQHLSMYDFENLPIAKSAFFKHDLKFLSHHEGVISTQNGSVSLSLGNYNPLSFTFKLLYGESCRDELGGVKLTRFGLQETKDGQVNLFVRAPVKGFYYLTIYSTQLKRSAHEESIFNAVCEYKIICDVPYPNAEPYPFVSDTNWGPGAEVYQAGLIPNIRDAVIVAPDGHIELDFEKVRPVGVLPKLISTIATEKQCEQAIKQDDSDFITRLDIDLPVNGEYALEIYANDPEKDGNTYTHVCQYLLVKPSPGDNSAAVFYQTPTYQECINVHGLQEPLRPVTMSLEQLARGMNDVRITDKLASEPRPSAKQAAQRVEIEQITVPSTKSKPGTAPKPSKDKPAVPGKPAPKPKPKPGWRGSGNDDYANMPLSGGQVGTAGMDGYQQPVEYLEQQSQNAAMSQQGAAPGKYRGRGQEGYDEYGRPLAGDPRYAGQEGFDEYGRPLGGDPRLAGQPGFDEFGRPLGGDPRYIGKEGYDEYGRPTSGDPRMAGQPGYDEYGRPLAGDPRFAGKDGWDQYGRPLAGDPRLAGQEGFDEYGRPLTGNPFYAGKEGYDEYGMPLGGDQRYAGMEGFDEFGRPLAGDPRYAGKEGYDQYGRPWTGDPYSDEHVRALAADPRMAGQPGYDEFGRLSNADPRMAGQPGYDEYGRLLDADPRMAGQPGYDEYGRLLDADPRMAGQPGYDEYGRLLDADPRMAGQPGYDEYGRPLVGDPRMAGKDGYDEYGRPLVGDPRMAGKDGYDEYGRPLVGDPRMAGKDGYDEYGRPLVGDPRMAGKDGYDEYGRPLVGDPRMAGKDGYDEYGRPLVGDPRMAGKDGYDQYGVPLARYGQSQDDLRRGRLRAGDEEMLGGQYGGRGPSGRAYSQSGVSDEDFPAPPPASDMLNMEFAPERSTAEVPIAPKSFEPMHIAEVDTQLSNVPKPVPPQLHDNLVFSAERAQQFKTVDTHAVQVAKTEHNSFRDLIWDLIYDQNITDDLEKARVIFLWLCTKDLGGMQFLNVQPGSPEEILLNVKQGKASYAQIYETLCSYAGLHCRVIRGYAKGADYKPGMRFRGTQAFHAWNAVLIHGHWRLIDCHWASRRMFGKKGTEHIRYELDDYYFCVDPRQLIYTHFPEDKQWQLLEQPYELEEFEDLPLVKSLFFRYCLQLESHTFATIIEDDEFNVTVNYQYYRGPGLEFTFSLHTDDGEESVSGLALSRFGVQETTNDGKANFRIRPPAVGVYKLAVYAREVQLGETANRMYCAVVEYRLEVGAVPPHIVPYPACSGTTWGISPASAKKHGLSTKFTSGVIYTTSGQSEVRFKLNRQLLFSGKLKSNVYSEKDLQSCILYRTVGDTAIFSVSVPAYGEYGLEVFVNDPAIDGKTLRHMCQYLLICDEPQVSGIRFPQLPAAYLGPQQAYSRLGMSTISNRDPLIHCTSGAIEVSFATTTPLRATSNLILTASNQDLTEYILQQYKDNTLSFLIRLPKAGIYKFQIFAQPLDDSSDSLPGVYNYLINCSNVPAVPLSFPKQFSQWKEGCYLYTPVDGDLAAAQSPQDPTPNYIFYQISVPNASRVAVVVGGEWTHLELSQDGVWEGAAFFQAGWGKEHTAALTANYGSDVASYNTLLEFRM